MLKVALPRHSPDAVYRGDGRGPSRSAFDDAEEPPVHRLTRDEAAALLRRQPTLSPWWVVAAQVAVGAVVAAIVGAVSGSVVAAQSALYGAAVVALPGALMARGATSRLSSLSPTISAVSILWWSFIKIGLSVGMLVLAVRIIPAVVWPALLAAMVLCMQSYWFALLWRGRADGANQG